MGKPKTDKWREEASHRMKGNQNARRTQHKRGTPIYVMVPCEIWESFKVKANKKAGRELPDLELKAVIRAITAKAITAYLEQD